MHRNIPDFVYIRRVKNLIMRLITVIISIIIPIVSIAGDWGLVSIPVACMRGDRSNSAELVSQAILGTPLKLIGHEGEWWEVETPDGYRGFMTESSFVEANRNEWAASRRMVVTAMPGTELVDERGRRVSPLPSGAIVTVGKNGTITLPDGRSGITDPSALTPIEQWGAQPYDGRKIVSTCRTLIGVPYLWGGMSPSATDCSGLVRIAFWAIGRLLPRDASVQALEGDEVDESGLQPGDLVFLDRSGAGRVTHVAVYAGDGILIHASGCVKINSLDRNAPDVLTGTIITMRHIEGKTAIDSL